MKKVKIEASPLFRDAVCTGKRRVRPLRDMYRKYDISMSAKELQEIGQGSQRPEKQVPIYTHYSERKRKGRSDRFSTALNVITDDRSNYSANAPKVLNPADIF